VIENFNYTIIPNSSFQTIYFFQNVNQTGTPLPGANPSLWTFVADQEAANTVATDTYSDEL